MPNLVFVLATYEGIPIGWIQHVEHKWYSLIPKHLRIQKLQPSTSLYDYMKYNIKNQSCVGEDDTELMGSQQENDDDKMC